jgi:short-subunit dehydrogenase
MITQSLAPVVWITGASAGIGRALALAWARRGYRVALSARRIELLQNLAHEITQMGGEALVLPVDVTRETDLSAAVEQMIAKWGRLDVAVANAGYGVYGALEKLSASDWERQLAGNVIGLAMTAKYALPELRKTQGRLGLVGSVAAFVPNPGVSAYGASKAAVNSLGLSLQCELAGSGVSCTVMHPGFVVSDIARVDNHGQFHPERRDPRPAKLMWSTDVAAEVMVKALLRRKRNYIFTAHGRLAVALQRWTPWLMRMMMSKVPRPMEG